MKPARLSKRAQRDLARIRDHIARDNPPAAERLRLAILDTADLLAEKPEMGTSIQYASARHAEVRWFVLPRFRNFLIFYRPSAKAF